MTSHPDFSIYIAPHRPSNLVSNQDLGRNKKDSLVDVILGPGPGALGSIPSSCRQNFLFHSILVGFRSQHRRSSHRVTFSIEHAGACRKSNSNGASWKTLKT